MDECVFCKIVKGEIPSTKEFEDERVVVIKNINPVAETHLLIIPKKHIDTFMDLTDEMESLVKVSQAIVKSKNLGKGYKLNINGGKYQSVMHFHIHLLAGKLEDNDDILNNT